MGVLAVKGYPTMNNTSLQGKQSPAPLDDCTALLGAVQARLRSGAGRADDAGHDAGWLRQQVLECADALGQLQMMLTLSGAQSDVADQGSSPAEVPALQEAQQEIGDRAGLRVALALAQAALNIARIELADTQAEEEQARHLALHDGLTALPNRRHFRQRLDHDLAVPLPAGAIPVLAVLYLDLDGLKAINDKHGHAAGDELLRIVAARLARSIRARDMVCRLGGDEFACLLSNEISREQLSHLACKLFDAVSAPLKIGALELTVRPSIGVALCPGDGVTTDDLLRRADAAMYRAKRLQMGYAFFDASSDA